MTEEKSRKAKELVEKIDELQWLRRRALENTDITIRSKDGSSMAAVLTGCESELQKLRKELAEL